MSTLEIVLMICGIVCVIVSYMMGSGGSESSESSTEATELTLGQKENIQNQINTVVEKELESLGERTEVTLEKISNTKILEMNEYADTVLGEINRNHNETVFLYDMLNEKAKEVKSTVKDVNVTKLQVAKMQAEVAVTDEINEDDDEYEADKMNAASAVEMLTKNVNLKQVDNTDIIKSRSNTVAKSPKKSASNTFGEINSKSIVKSIKNKNATSQQKSGNIGEMNIQFEKGANNNDKVLKLYSDGKSNKDIAKELSLGVGEVKLVIDLYNSGK